MTAKRASLASLAKAGSALATPTVNERGAGAGDRKVANSRVGRVSLPIWVPEEQRTKLKLEAARTKSTIQEIVQELIDGWEKKHDARKTA